MQQEMDYRKWSVLFLTAGLSGSSFFFIKLTVDSIPPLTLAACRSGLAAIIVYSLMRSSGYRLPAAGADWIPLGVLGVLTAAIPYTAIAWGQLLIDSSLGGILFATIPVFSVLIAPLFLEEESFTRGRLLGAGIGVSGVVIVIGPDVIYGLGSQVAGAAITLVAALSYAVGSIYARKQSRLTAIVMATGQLTVASLVLVILSMLFESPWSLSPTRQAILSLVVVAVFSTAITGFLFFWLIRNAGATNTSLLAFFIPVTAVILGTFALGESLAWPTLAGFFLILLGAATVTGRLHFPRDRDAGKTMKPTRASKQPIKPGNRGDRHEIYIE